MKLPELSESASPEFTDAATCKAWLEHVPLANVAAAQGELLSQLEEFNRFPTTAAQRLAVLEALREAVNFVQIEQAKRFANRALPMTEAENTAFETTIGLWDQMSIGYQRCLDGALNRDSGMRAQAALVCARLASYIGLRMFHYYRAYRQAPSDDWRALHETYAASEKLDVAEDAVKDFLNRDIQDTSPRIAYARGVLMGLCNPNELGQRQLTFVAYLLERWGGKLEVQEKPVDEGEGVPPLIADLASDACPERGETASKTTAAEPRYLDARKLSKSLRNRVALLRKGESPAKLALGEDCVQPSCEQLLVYLYRHWCQPKPPRAIDRRTASAPAEACSELPGIHYYISGRVFKAPNEQTELTQKQREEIATFGRVSTREEDDYSNAKGFVVEQWQIEDESAQGMRMVRQAKEPGKRMAHGQLIGVRPGDGKQFMLAQVRWLMGADNGDLHAGVKLLPGLPSPLAVRPTGLNVQQDSWVPALALSAVPALESPPSLVLPTGWYKPKRIVELYADRSSKAMLTEVIERGIDFERVAYQIVP
jgi:cyclic-di-GMP-binding protein